MFCKLREFCIHYAILKKIENFIYIKKKRFYNKKKHYKGKHCYTFFSFMIRNIFVSPFKVQMVSKCSILERTCFNKNQRKKPQNVTNVVT